MSKSKNKLLNFVTIAAGDMSTASLTSTVTNIQHLDDIGYQFFWTGSPVGTFAIQVSSDYAEDYSSPPNVTNSGHWTPMTFTYFNGTNFITATSIPTSVGSPVFVDIALTSAPWIRVVYTKTSGTGSLTTSVTAKEI